MRNHFIFIRISTIKKEEKKTENYKYWQGCEEPGTFVPYL